jgi:dihydrodipicolinate synthase/N-acetylneuraminate lyase
MDIARRELLKALSPAALGVLLPKGFALAAASSAHTKPLRGIFPIAQTPFTASDKLDLDSLVEELRFLDRGGVHGFVWPQNASEWTTLTDAERLAGAEAVLSSGKQLRPAIVIGVQAPTVATAIRYAKHAERNGADAIISLPPAKQARSDTVLDYYKQIGSATELPLFLQAVDDLSVDAIIEMYRAIPTLRYVKDEAGEPLLRFAALRRRSSNALNVFSGGHGRTLIDEMVRGFSGSMPAASFADLYARAWDLWHEGKEREALAMFGNASILINEIGAYPEGMKYILYLRGVFKTYAMRPPSDRITSPPQSALDDTAKQVFKKILDLMKPYLRS